MLWTRVPVSHGRPGGPTGRGDSVELGGLVAEAMGRGKLTGPRVYFNREAPRHWNFCVGRTAALE